MLPQRTHHVFYLPFFLLISISSGTAQELPAKHPQADKASPINDTTALPQMTVTAPPVDEKTYTVPNTTTATKTDTPIMETPATIQVVPNSVIHDQQAYRLQDVIKNVPGVQSYHAYGGDHENFVVRGFLQSTVNYRNGIRIPMTKFDLANVERVEVLKGASAMLYGFNDAGGIINIITKQPSSTPQYSLEQRFGDSANSYADGAYASADLMAAYTINLGHSMLTAQVNINNLNDAEYFYLRSRRTNLPAEPLTAIGSIRLEY